MKQARVVAWLLVSLFLAALCALAEEKKPVPLYTNEDLARVRPWRDQTGVASRPAIASDREPAPEEDRFRARSEAFWRREWQRLQTSLSPLRAKLEAVRRQIEERRDQEGVRPLTDPQILSWERSIRDIEARIREREGALEDRARRAGALPGWLR